MLNNSVELLEHAIIYAKKKGFRIRTEALDGTASGFCLVQGTPNIFLDQASTADQQLVEIMKVLQRDRLKVTAMEE